MGKKNWVKKYFGKKKIGEKKNWGKKIDPKKCHYPKRGISWPPLVVPLKIMCTVKI